MKTGLLLLLLNAPLVAAAQTLPVKTGAWETTTKSTALPRPLVVKDCVTKADLSQLTAGPDKDDDEDCKLTKGPTIVGKTWTADRKCSDGRTVKAEFTAESQEKVAGIIVSTMPKGGPVVRVEVASKWLGSNCSGLK